MFGLIFNIINLILHTVLIVLWIYYANKYHKSGDYIIAGCWGICLICDVASLILKFTQ